MIIVDIRKLNAKKSYSGEMEFSYDAPTSLIEIPFVSFEGPVKVRFSYELYEDDSMDIKGNVFYRLEGQCSRCLKESAKDITGELEAYFQPCKDFEDYGYTNGMVNITKAVEDAIMASMPFTLSCEEECEGIPYSG